MKLVAASLAASLLLGIAGACSVSEGSSKVFADMHDGDKKQVSVSSGTVTITPYGNNQTWVVAAPLNADCTASIDFDVPGKPSPPPVPLLLVLQTLVTPGNLVGSTPAAACGFTDPTGTLAEPAFPLNYWIEIND